MNSRIDSVKTILTISVGFIVIYLVTDNRWAILTSLLIGLIGIFSSHLSAIISNLWMKLAWLLSFIVPNILLGLVYFLVLVPVALLSRFLGKKDLLRLKNVETSNFHGKRHEIKKQAFEKMW